MYVCKLYTCGALLKFGITATSNNMQNQNFKTQLTTAFSAAIINNGDDFPSRVTCIKHAEPGKKPGTREHKQLKEKLNLIHIFQIVETFVPVSSCF